jgi:p-aminobenzoyl-glutamate transporter AbgT
VESDVEILDIVVVVLFLVGWFVLMRFILPRLGVST